MTNAAEERGAGTVLAVSMLGFVMLVATTLGLVAGVIRAHREAQAAADLTALAAAQTLVAGGDPCRTAAELASANRGELLDCVATSIDVRVTVRVAGPRWWGLGVDPAAESRAGPDRS